jgi:hypothetical protein
LVISYCRCPRDAQPCHQQRNRKTGPKKLDQSQFTQERENEVRPSQYAILKSFWTLDICASHFFPSHPSTRTRSGATKEQQRQSHLKASELSCKRQRGLAVAASVRRAFLPFSCQASAFDFKESRLDPKKPLTGLDYEKTPPPIRCPQPWAVLTARAAPCQVSLQFCKFRSSTVPPFHKTPPFCKKPARSFFVAQELT